MNLNQDEHPLQLGEILYEELDATIIIPNHQGDTADYHRIVFEDNGMRITESLDLSKINDNKNIKVITNTKTGKQEIFIITNNGIVCISYDGTQSIKKFWPISNAYEIKCIIDVDYQNPNENLVYMACSKNGCIYITKFNCSSGQLQPVVNLDLVKGTILGGFFLRYQLKANMVLVCENEGRLSAYSILSKELKAKNTPKSLDIEEVFIGEIFEGSDISIKTVRMINSTSNQQLAIVYYDSAQHCQVVLLGFVNDSGQTTLTKLSNLKADTSFATVEKPIFRLEAGDLLTNGVDQIVIGFPATYNEVGGCVALMLIEGTSQSNDLTEINLFQLSEYVCCNTNKQPLASIDLQLAVGLFGFGKDLGVLVMGASSTFKELLQGEGWVYGGIVTVDTKNKRFPDFDVHNIPCPTKITKLARINPDTDGFYGFKSDITGLSIVLGPPKFSQALGKQQFLAIIQSPPYEAGVCEFPPSLTFSKTISDQNACNVTSNKMWTFSNDAGTHIGVSKVSLQETISNHYGVNFDKTSEDSSTNTVHISTTISKNDMLLTYAMNYYIWTYPITRTSRQTNESGTLMVIFPQGNIPVQTLIPANDKNFGYNQKYEAGSLLPYLNVNRKESFTIDNLLFNGLISCPVTQEATGSTVSYDKSNMKLDNINKLNTIHNSFSNNIQFAETIDEFVYLPLSFGLNITDSQSYSDSEAVTTSLSHTESLNISLHSGNVLDIGYKYQIIPYIYYHKKIGCLMVDYDVELNGETWEKFYKLPKVKLMCPYNLSNNKLDACFSRSIKFNKKNNDEVEITVEVFNNSYSEAHKVTCDFYFGKPEWNDHNQKPTLPKKNSFACGKLDRLKTTEWGSIITTCCLKTLEEEKFITVEVKCEGMIDSTIYWGTYPMSPAFNLF